MIYSKKSGWCYTLDNHIVELKLPPDYKILWFDGSYFSVPADALDAKLGLLNMRSITKSEKEVVWWKRIK